MKKRIRIFVSYAHKSRKSANEFSGKFIEYISASKKYEYLVWRDVEILVGQNWHEQIQNSIKDSQVCILLISPSFLISNYIKENELKNLMNTNKIIIPVGLSTIDFERHDLLGLEKNQIFRLGSNDFLEPRFYSQLKPKRKDEFIERLFIQLEERLNNYCISL